MQEKQLIKKILINNLIQQKKELQFYQEYMKKIQKLMQIILMIDQGNDRVNIKDSQQEILLVSQFTLYGYTKGTKVDFSDAMKHDEAYKLYNYVYQQIESQYPGKTKTGFFGKMMSVQIDNDGPFTLIFDSRPNGPEDTRYLVQYPSYKRWVKEQNKLKKQNKQVEQQ